MKWFKKKKKSKSFDDAKNTSAQARVIPQYGTPPASKRAGLLVAELPVPILQRIFALVCPHTQDETYESCEQSTIEDRCMLCDLRDLSHCARVSRRWRKVAGTVLYVIPTLQTFPELMYMSRYHSIRIDAVHYCELEDVLAEKRKRGSFMHRNVEPEDTAQARLKFLQRTLRDNLATFAYEVQFLKTPYMTRETCKPDLARCAAICPNLRYIDLPEGIFSDDLSCNTLKQEIQGRCPDLRKMSYMGGSERSLEMLASGTLWRNLEVLELSKLNLDPTILRRALGALPHLVALKVTDMKAFQDNAFQHSDFLPPFPPLTEIIFENTPNVTAEGLAAYLSSPDVQTSLKTLSFTETGVHPSSLHRIVSAASHLEHLSIIESVLTSFPAPGSVPLLQSRSLKTFHYEITSGSSANSYNNTTASYYSYLTSSLMSGGLPNLVELYVRDPDFPETLLDLAPPMPGFAIDPDNFTPPNPAFGSMPTNPRFSSNNPFAKMQSAYVFLFMTLHMTYIFPVVRSSTALLVSNRSSQDKLTISRPGLTQALEVYSKGLDEMEWNFSKVQPPTKPGRRGSASAARPISSYGLSNLDSVGKWQGNGARRSVIVGNGFGGFLSVPADGGRPSTSSGEQVRKRGSQYDMWR
jgi:hypothetical protein